MKGVSFFYSPCITGRVVEIINVILIYVRRRMCYELARKDGRSFREARTLTEETESIRAAIHSSTGYKNKWAVEVFKEWQYYRATKGQLMRLYKLLTRLLKE
jgi:hypothetical protein